MAEEQERHQYNEKQRALRPAIQPLQRTKQKPQEIEACARPMPRTNEAIGQACNALAYYKHCRSAAARLARCQQSQPGACEAAAAGFQTCAQANSQAILTDLMAVASTRCAAMVQRYQDCQAQYGEQKCAHLDQAALECAAQRVLSSMGE